MQTTTVRVDSDLLLLANQAARIERIKPAEFIRRSIQLGIQTIAKENPEFKQKCEEVYERRLIQAQNAIERNLGFSPTGGIPGRIEE